MSVSRRLPSTFPDLRRFSAALTGSQSANDAYVFATLEAIIEDPTIVAQAGDCDRVHRSLAKCGLIAGQYLC